MALWMNVLPVFIGLLYTIGKAHDVLVFDVLDAFVAFVAFVAFALVAFCSDSSLWRCVSSVVNVVVLFHSR